MERTSKRTLKVLVSRDIDLLLIEEILSRLGFIRVSHVDEAEDADLVVVGVYEAEGLDAGLLSKTVIVADLPPSIGEEEFLGKGGGHICGSKELASTIGVVLGIEYRPGYTYPIN